MKNSVTNFARIATIVAALVFVSACDKEDLPVQGTFTGATPNVTAPVQNIPAAGEDAEPFIIWPQTGWEIDETSELFFRAYLLVDGQYVDVTHNEKTKWDTSYGSGMLVHGDDPSLRNGQEIVVKCSYKSSSGLLPAQSCGRFWLSTEYENVPHE